MKRSTGLVAVLALACATGATAQTDERGGLAFALIGDMPYSAAQVSGVYAMLAAINTDPSVRFVVHVGDIKGGTERCDDALIEARLQQLQAIETALLYTPGDNEWTDCHRPNNGGFVPTERLALVRKLFFPKPSLSLGKRPIAVTPQSDTPGFETFVENSFFVQQQVVFATVHVVGSANGYQPWGGIDAQDSAATPRADRLAEVQGREDAALAWIDRVFDEATQRNAAGVWLAMQANPGIEYLPGAAQRRGFEAVLAKLKARALVFNKPVVLAQGDNHELLIDMPLYRDAEPSPKVPQLTRIQGFGSPRLHWVKVWVDPRSPAVFRFEPQLVPSNR